MVLLVPIILYAYHFKSVAFDEDFYKEKFTIYNVYSDLIEYDIEKINRDVLNYIKYEKNNELIGNNFFNQREKEHFLDVKNLIQKIFSIYYFSIVSFFLLLIILFILLNFNFKIVVNKLLLVLFLGSLLTFFDAFIGFILSSINFDFVFDLMHKTFFPVGTFSFNPELEKIVVLYPESLFFDALIKIFINTVSSSVILFFASFFISFYFFKRNFFKFLSNFPDGQTNK